MLIYPFLNAKLEDTTMAVTLQVKNVKPFSEVTFKVNDTGKTVIMGVRLYKPSELPAIHNEYKSILFNDRQQLLQARLDKLVETGDRTKEDFYAEQNALISEIQEIVSQEELRFKEFYKKHITHLRDVTLEATKEDGTKFDIIIPDTRQVQPNESLWSDEKECLAVLLDVYFDTPGLGDSLIQNISDIVFQRKDAASAKAKN